MRREPREGYLDFTKSVIKIRRTVLIEQSRWQGHGQMNGFIAISSMLLVFTNGYFNLTCLSKDATETRLL